MLIGISGKIGSGKDTVGKIIQVICFLDKINIPWSKAAFEHNYKKNFSGNDYYGDWHIKKFAAKLKQTVALLTGCKTEDLESQEFKNKSLGSEWTQKFRLIEYADLTPQQRARVDIPGQSAKVAEEWIPTYRWLLQVLGTEAMRNNVHTNVWVNALFADYNKKLNSKVFPDDNEEVWSENYPKWIITDMRFPNELQAIEERGGITIRVKRTQYLAVGTLATHEHPSETSLDNSTFKHVIDNDGTIEELVEKVRKILIDEGIIK